MEQAKGDFEVEVKPVSSDGETPPRMSINKSFTGDFIGRSTGQMMTGGNEANGSRVYVALETIEGSLNGIDGSFIAAHRGTMTKDGHDLSIMIVPDSGTGALTGIRGNMDIQNNDGEHSYTIDYALPD